MNSELEPAAAFRLRIAGLVGKEEPFAWAKRVGIPSSTFDRIWNQGVIPKAGHLIRISEFCGVSIDWLLTGKTSGTINVKPPQPIDFELVKEIIETVLEWMDEEDVTAKPAKIAQLVEVLYEQVVESAKSEQQPVNLQNMRRLIRLVV